MESFAEARFRIRIGVRNSSNSPIVVQFRCLSDHYTSGAMSLSLQKYGHLLIYLLPIELADLQFRTFVHTQIVDPFS